MLLAHTLSILTQRLAVLSDTAALDAQVLLAHCLERPRAWVLAHPEASLAKDQQAALDEALNRLEAGEPLPYVLGSWEFYGLHFHVTPDVLIPRPESELLVERALQWLHDHPSRRFAADLGTGSGCIAISLAVHIPDLHILTSDISASALRVARVNAHQHRVNDRLSLVQADLLSPIALTQPLDLLCANLPYIPHSTLLRLPIYGREPTLALDGGVDGLSVIANVLAQAPGRMRAGGLLLLEIEARQGLSASTLAGAIFSYAQISVLPDLAGFDRLLCIQLPD
jgi:release factor glutamine methyltransferase